jgi:uncharacterized protein involved in exopolysaccharide biosynthesis
MSESISISNSSSDPRRVPERIPKTKKFFYLGIWLVANTVIWSAALLYLRLKSPTYSSTWTINVPFAGGSTNLSLPGIAQASSMADSPYRSYADPRESYKFLALSDEFIEAAANQLKIPVQEFGKPKIKIMDNTTLMKFEIKGNSPKQAQEKALVMQHTLEATLDKLRNQEIAHQETNSEGAISSDAKKLQIAQQRLSNYKSSSRLSSNEQLRDVTTNLELLRRQRAEIAAQLQETRAKVTQLSVSLGLSAEDAADALTLQSDRLFQQYLADYSQVSAELVNLNSKYLPDHPAVITKKMKVDASATALLQQGQSILRRPVSQATLKQLTIGGGSSESSSQRSALLQELISLQTQGQGTQAQTKELDQQIAQLQSRLKMLSEQESELDNLQRDVKISEAVFSSNLTKLSLSKSDISASTYPKISILMSPNLPKKPSSPKKLFVLAGTGACSFLLTTGLAALLIRERKLQRTKQIIWATSASANSNSIGSLNSISSRKQ